MSDADQDTINNVRAMRAMNGHDQVPEGFWLLDSREKDDDAARDEQFGADRYPGLVSLRFIRSAIKRSAKVWCALAAVGLLAGAAVYVARPVGYEATISLLMAQAPGAQPGWIADDQAEAQSLAVAEIALRHLGLHESPATFDADYTVVATTDRILVLTVKAASAPEALREATALAAAFLSFQASLLTKQDSQVDKALDQQVTAAQHKLDTIDAQITSLRPGPSSQQQQHNLRIQRDEVNSTLIHEADGHKYGG